MMRSSRGSISVPVGVEPDGVAGNVTTGRTTTTLVAVAAGPMMEIVTRGMKDKMTLLTGWLSTTFRDQVPFPELSPT